MAVSVSRKLLRSFYGSLYALGRCDSSTITCRSFCTYHGKGDIYLFVFSFSLYVLLWLSTSILTSELGEGAFPSNLLSKKPVAMAERTIGLYQDLVIPAGDVFNVPIRKDIVHRVVRWQLAKQQHMFTRLGVGLQAFIGNEHQVKNLLTLYECILRLGYDLLQYRTQSISQYLRKYFVHTAYQANRMKVLNLHHPRLLWNKGGGTMHGPKPRSHAFKPNRKVRRLGLKISLTAHAAEGKLLVFDDLEVPTHKTKNLVNYLKLATQNLHYANVLPSIGLNVYSILLYDTLLVSHEAVNKIVERMHTPINR
ncbi:hypothetical protein I3842_09G095500 [Carya illinoinensis]|uniref:Large ribosomal subunit protein uL4m n=1 Tax=Carya illinoinensis TaxID=32201 RepID=A0A922E3D9_CARIL|nr:hypothetical protein I3842_09G095500 [Carya illinoinensis]